MMMPSSKLFEMKKFILFCTFYLPSHTATYLRSKDDRLYYLFGAVCIPALGLLEPASRSINILACTR